MLIVTLHVLLVQAQKITVKVVAIIFCFIITNASLIVQKGPIKKALYVLIVILLVKLVKPQANVIHAKMAAIYIKINATNHVHLKCCHLKIHALIVTKNVQLVLVQKVIVTVVKLVISFTIMNVEKVAQKRHLKRIQNVSIVTHHALLAPSPKIIVIAVEKDTSCMKTNAN